MVVAFVAIYTAAVVIWLLLRALFFDQPWWLALVNSHVLYLFLPLPILVGTVLWQRRLKLLLLLAVPTVVFLLFYGGLLLPVFTANRNGRTLTIMTFNLLYSNDDYQAIARAIRTAAPDVVGLQETTRDHEQALAQMLAADYPYQIVRPGNRYGNAGLLSRYPIETVADFSLPPRELALQAIVNVDGQFIQVFVVHLMPNQLTQTSEQSLATRVVDRYQTRMREIARLEAAVMSHNERVLLLCDCNLTPTSQAYAYLDTFLDDSFSEAGWGLGHSNLILPVLNWPTQRIDYVWHSDHFTAVRARVILDGASDHLPVVADLKFK